MRAPVLSEKDILIAKLFKQGTFIFGSQDKFQEWLNAKNVVMGGEKPSSHLSTLSTINLVFDELNAIEHGFSA